MSDDDWSTRAASRAPEDRNARAHALIDTEWLVTNGIGGYSSSSLAGVITRRYHGILVAALPNPMGRMVMLNHVGEKISAGGVTTMLNGEDRVGGKIDAEVAATIVECGSRAGCRCGSTTWTASRSRNVS